jgi:Flp pilus assembly protein TadG
MRSNVLKNLREDESGQTLIFTALCITVLIGFVSLAIDVGVAFRAKTDLQKVADDAAIAGAAEIKTGNWSAAALASAAQNGVTSGVTVTLGAPYHPGAVYVAITQSQQTYLAPIFGVSNVPVGAQAAAGLVNSGNACLYALDTSAKNNNGLVINGQGSGAGIVMPTCGMYVNSGIVLNGTNSSITAKFVGGVSVTDPHNGITPAPITGIVPVNDPLASYWPQPPSGASQGNQTFSSGIVPPGTYGNLTVSGTASFSPGLYVIQGRLNVNVSTTSTGVTFFVDNANGGTLNCSQCALNGNFTAPPLGNGFTGTCSLSGGCDGLLLWDTESAASTQPVTFGTVTLTGILYLPSAALKFNGNGTTTLNSAIVAASYVLDGSVTMNNYALNAGGVTPFSSAALVE